MLKLGKRPARHDSIKLKFAAYIDRTALPIPPRRFGHERIGQPWGVFGNDEFSSCVWAGAAHEHMVWTHEAGGAALFNDKAVLSDYAAATGFDPAKPDTDQGSDMQQAASYRRRVGIVDAAGIRHKVDAYAALRPGVMADLMLATYLFGAVGIGLRFPDFALDQFDQQKPWSNVAGQPDLAGGHYVSCIGRNSNGLPIVVTWGRVHAMTEEFYETYCDEAVVYLSLEMLKDSVSPEGFDEQSLRRDLKRLAA